MLATGRTVPKTFVTASAKACPIRGRRQYCLRTFSPQAPRRAGGSTASEPLVHTHLVEACPVRVLAAHVELPIQAPPVLPRLRQVLHVPEVSVAQGGERDLQEDLRVRLP